MPDQPLGIADVFPERRRHVEDHYYWCRRHEQVHKVGENCREQLGGPGGGAPAWRMPSNEECIDVGPFMSEREANRLKITWAAKLTRGPLGMEVEQ